MDVVTRKGVYPYDYLYSLERFEVGAQPAKEDFYSTLKDENNITDESYLHAWRLSHPPIHILAFAISFWKTCINCVLSPARIIACTSTHSSTIPIETVAQMKVQYAALFFMMPVSLLKDMVGGKTYMQISALRFPPIRANVLNGAFVDSFR